MPVSWASSYPTSCYDLELWPQPFEYHGIEKTKAISYQDCRNQASTFRATPLVISCCIKFDGKFKYILTFLHLNSLLHASNQMCYMPNLLHLQLAFAICFLHWKVPHHIFFPHSVVQKYTSPPPHYHLPPHP